MSTRVLCATTRKPFHISASTGPNPLSLYSGGGGFIRRLKKNNRPIQPKIPAARKVVGNPAAYTSQPPRTGPSSAPPCVDALYQPSAAPRRSRYMSATVARALGPKIAVAAPWRNRNPVNMSRSDTNG